jgi:hypothetical protein
MENKNKLTFKEKFKSVVAPASEMRMLIRPTIREPIRSRNRPKQHRYLDII